MVQNLLTSATYMYITLLGIHTRIGVILLSLCLVLKGIDCPIKLHFLKATIFVPHCQALCPCIVSVGCTLLILV